MPASTRLPHVTADVIPIGRGYQLLRGPEREAERERLVALRLREAFDRACNQHETPADFAMWADREARVRMVETYGYRLEFLQAEQLVAIGGMDDLLRRGTGIIRAPDRGGPRSA